MRRIATALAAAATLMLLGMPAMAGGPTSASPLSLGGLQRGAAPLPEFHLDFLLDDAAARTNLQPVPSLPLPGGQSNFEIALTAPDNSVFRFVFSPRAQFGAVTDKNTGLSKSYAGLTWNLFDSESIFGNLGLAGTYDTTTQTDASRRLLGPPILLHGALELGYHINERNSLSLSLDQAVAPELRAAPETNDNLRIRYGLKF